MGVPYIAPVQALAGVPGKSAIQEGTIFLDFVHDGVVALSGGGQTGATQLLGKNCRIATVANVGDSVMLPEARVGADITVLNDTVKAIQVFGNGTDTIDAGASSAGVSQMGNSVVIYSCYVAGAWRSIDLSTGFDPGLGLQTLSFASGIVAHSGGTQALAVPLTRILNRITTVAAAQDSVALPPNSPGMVVYIDNQGANGLQVFGDNTAGDKINGIATATGVSQAPKTIVAYYCHVAGNWETSGGGALSYNPIAITANGAIDPHTPGSYVITKAGIATLTIAAPTATTDDGVVIEISSNTNNQHTLGFGAGNLLSGAAANTTLTWPANNGGAVKIMAYQGKWILIANNLVVAS